MPEGHIGQSCSSQFWRWLGPELGFGDIFSLRLFLTCRMCLRWKKQDLAMEEIWFFMESALSNRTPRSRTNSAGLMEQSGLRLRTEWSMSQLCMGWRLNQMSSVLEAFSLRRMDAHQSWISVKQACRRDLALSMSLVASLIYSCVSSA